MRRAFRRQMRRAFVPEIPPILQRANALLEQGDYAGAAEAFEQIARGAEARGGPRAPLFYLQAGRARLLAGGNEAGVNHLKHGLSLLAQRGQSQRLHQIGNRVINELKQRGRTKEASEIQAWLTASLPGGFTAPHIEMSPKRPLLPTHCPGCGAPLRPDEVEWLDNITAECVYCGSPVRAEED